MEDNLMHILTLGGKSWLYEVLMAKIGAKIKSPIKIGLLQWFAVILSFIILSC